MRGILLVYGAYGHSGSPIAEGAVRCGLRVAGGRPAGEAVGA